MAYYEAAKIWHRMSDKQQRETFRQLFGLKGIAPEIDALGDAPKGYSAARLATVRDAAFLPYGEAMRLYTQADSLGYVFG